MTTLSHENCIMITRDATGSIIRCISCNRVVNITEENIALSEELGAGHKWEKLTNEKNPDPDKVIDDQADIDDVSPEHLPFVNPNTIVSLVTRKGSK